MSADPLTIHQFGADLNPYAYVGGRVMSDVDPFGLEDKPEAPSCIGKEKCGEIPDWQKELQKTAPPVAVDGGMTVPNVEKPVKEEKPAFDPGKDLNWLDRWILSDNGGFHDAITSDRNLAVVQTGLTAITIVAATIATGGLALEAAGLTLEGVGATAIVHASRVAQVFTEFSLAEQGIVGVGAGAGAGGRRSNRRGRDPPEHAVRGPSRTWSVRRPQRPSSRAWICLQHDSSHTSRHHA